MAHIKSETASRVRLPPSRAKRTAGQPDTTMPAPPIAAGTASTHRAIDAVWRMESPKLIAALARMVRDVGRAEDLAHDALVIALEQWPSIGIPRNPAPG